MTELVPGEPAPLGEIPEDLQGVIINDCGDANAQARQQARFNSLFGVQPTFIGLSGEHPDLEAGGQLIDVLDAATTPSSYPEVPSVVLVNVAPRGDDIRQKWENGTPFGYVELGNTTIFAPFEGRVLPMLRKLDLADEVQLLDIPEVTGSFVDRGILEAEEAKKINDTQFRSLEFLPLAARELVGGNELPAETVAIPDHPSVEGRAWFFDNFGNVKTTLLPGDVGFEEGKTLELAGGKEVTCYERLADVPTGAFALTIGSSGYGSNRLLEVVQQRGRAADGLEIGIGSQILAHETTAAA